jgi:hypothetical protein
MYKSHYRPSLSNIDYYLSLQSSTIIRIQYNKSDRIALGCDILVIKIEKVSAQALPKLVAMTESKECRISNLAHRISCGQLSTGLWWCVEPEKPVSLEKQCLVIYLLELSVIRDVTSSTILIFQDTTRQRKLNWLSSCTEAWSVGCSFAVSSMC